MTLLWLLHSSVALLRVYLDTHCDDKTHPNRVFSHDAVQNLLLRESHVITLTLGFAVGLTAAIALTCFDPAQHSYGSDQERRAELVRAVAERSGYDV